MAGLRVDGTGWVRPIAPNTDHGQLYGPHYRLNDGSPPEVLDVIRIDLASHRPQPGQPENWVMGEQPWALISPPQDQISMMSFGLLSILVLLC